MCVVITGISQQGDEQTDGQTSILANRVHMTPRLAFSFNGDVEGDKAVH